MTVAEKTLLSIIDRWLVYTQDNPNSFKYDLRDELAFAFLLIVEEQGEHITDRETILDRLKEIRAKTLNGVTLGMGADILFANINLMPWDLAARFLKGSTDTSEISVLNYYLVHELSGVRMQSMRVAWFIKERLPRDDFANALLKNLADTLGHLTPSLGLARALFKTDEEFFEFAAAFDPPPEFEDQYRTRLQRIQDEELQLTSAYVFIGLERRVRRLIMAMSMGLGVGKESARQKEFEFQ